jgi:hypothetical protein
MCAYVRTESRTIATFWYVHSYNHDETVSIKMYRDMKITISQQGGAELRDVKLVFDLLIKIKIGPATAEPK